MKRITYPRVDLHGNIWKKKDIEAVFVGYIETKIKTNLQNLKVSKKEKVVVDKILAELHTILIASPTKLVQYMKIKDDVFKLTASRQKRFLSNLLVAFGYKNFRRTVLPDIAKMLNLKSCPYCNMQYTIYAEKGTNRDDRLAKMQFDHFIDKDTYPWLSMSLYNLVPSCGCCNQGKSKTPLPIKFNPYKGSLADMFHFEVVDPLVLFYGSRKKDLLELALVADAGATDSEIKDYDKVFHLKALYSRHKDIAQEVFDKAYEDPYYADPSNFTYLQKRDPEYMKRLWFGNYMRDDQIPDRPMSKFVQDIEKQAHVRKIKGLIP